MIIRLLVYLICEINKVELNLETGEITAGAYHVSITEIVGLSADCLRISTEALLIINVNIFSLLWGNQCFFLFGSHIKDEIGRISATATAILLKFDCGKIKNYGKIR